MQLQSHMQHNFGATPSTNIQRSAFDRSHGLKTTFDAGKLVPIYSDEVLPGDTFNLSLTAFARMTTPIYPLMDNLYLDVHFFFCPLRLVWTNFVKMMGEQDNPGDSISYICPTSTAPVGGYANQSLQDYLTLPTQVAGYVHNVFHTRAYNLTYNQWYRDENMQNSVTVDKGDGPDTPTNYVLLNRGKRFDYFTSCLPFAQKGTAIPMPLGLSAPVISTGTAPEFYPLGGGVPYFNLKATAASTSVVTSTAAGQTGAFVFNNNTGLVTDLTNATGATINQLRQSFQIQTLLERDARGGTRYTEIIRSHFSVVSPDARLQRVEYLGGGTAAVNISPIAQTSATASQPSPQGNLAAMATVTMHNCGFTKSFTEHGVILGIASVRADLTYQQGLARMYSRSTRYDFYWPAFAQIGEQPVYNKEIYCQGSANPTQDAATFGYQERFGEYRSKLSAITGKLRSNDAATLNAWHLAQNFSSLPALNTAFIQENPPMSRVLAVTTQPAFIYDSYVKLTCARPMPVFGIPYDLGRF